MHANQDATGSIRQLKSLPLGTLGDYLSLARFDHVTKHVFILPGIVLACALGHPDLRSLLFTIPLFVSENVRLYGWVLFFIKNGVLLGTLKTLGIEPESWLFTQSIILFGMVYVYLPFMLFPMTLGISMVPKETRDAAFDLGATRWQVFKEVDLPLSMPGITIGFLLSFVLAVGAIAEAKVLGGQRIIPVTHDIEIAFTYAQNWPMGSALSVMLMLVVGVLVLAVLRRFDLDTILGKK